LDRLADDQLIEPSPRDELDMKSAEADAWPCQTCRVREAGLCGSLLRGQGSPSEAEYGRLQQEFHRSLPRRNIYDAGRATDDVFVICSGWAFRFAQLPDGRRQTLSILLPGDVVSGVSLFARKLGYSVQALTKVSYCRFSRSEILNSLTTRPEVLESLTSICLVEKERADEAITDLGRRSASERISRFILQLMDRLAARGMVKDQSFEFPLRQQHIADAVGLTTVHVSRVIGAFRQSGLVEIGGGRLTIGDLAELRRAADVK
jgi:CRP-like cAMP-binding protein